ncbi:hypothetical protein PTKIN_Ptkin11bG0140500 [Pterospermum kingtungense]
MPQNLFLNFCPNRNGGTEYLCRFLCGQTDEQLFKNSVPIVTYEDIKPYIHRVTNGEPSDILLAEPHCLLSKPGTSGGQPKLIPATAEHANKRAIFTTMIGRNEVVMIGSIFASTVLRAIEFLKDYWQERCSNINTDQKSDWIMDSGCRNTASLIMKPNPELADSIENICNCKLWEGIIRKLWPKAKYMSAICRELMDYHVSLGASLSQYKTPSCIKPKEA